MRRLVRSVMRGDHRIHDQPKTLERRRAKHDVRRLGRPRRSPPSLAPTAAGAQAAWACSGRPVQPSVADAVDHVMHARQRARAIDRVERRDVDARVLPRRHPPREAAILASAACCAESASGLICSSNIVCVATKPSMTSRAKIVRWALQFATLGSSLNQTGWEVPAQGVTSGWAC